MGDRGNSHDISGTSEVAHGAVCNKVHTKFYCHSCCFYGMCEITLQGLL